MQFWDLNRSSLYYRPVAVSAEKQRLMNRLDEIFTEYPFMGSRRMMVRLRQEGFEGGRGRALDNVFVERLWRSVKYEDIYLREYSGGIE